MKQNSGLGSQKAVDVAVLVHLQITTVSQPRQQILTNNLLLIEVNKQATDMKTGLNFCVCSSLHRSNSSYPRAPHYTHSKWRSTARPHWSSLFQIEVKGAPRLSLTVATAAPLPCQKEAPLKLCTPKSHHSPKRFHHHSSSTQRS